MSYKREYPAPWGQFALHWTGEGPDWQLKRIELLLTSSAKQQPSSSNSPIDQLAEQLALLRIPPNIDKHLDWSQRPPFTRHVLQTLREHTQPGSNITYGQLARAAGRPPAARAIARIMATNPFPLIAPCHRVCAANGPGGFLGGRQAEKLALKKALLSLEKHSAQG